MPYGSRPPGYKGGDPGAQWGTGPAPAPTGRHSPAPSWTPLEQEPERKNPVSWLLAVIVLVLVAIIAVLIYLLAASTGTFDVLQQNQAQNTGAEVAEAAPAEQAPGPGYSSGVGPLVAVAPEGEPTSVAPAPVSEPLPEHRTSISGALSYGWAENPSVNCAGNEDLVYAGRGDDAWVTVCRAGDGAMTYRSDVFGGNLTAPVSAAHPAAGQFTVDAAPSVISINNSQLLVHQNGRVVSQAVLDEVVLP